MRNKNLRCLGSRLISSMLLVGSVAILSACGGANTGTSSSSSSSGGGSSSSSSSSTSSSSSSSSTSSSSSSSSSSSGTGDPLVISVVDDSTYESDPGAIPLDQKEIGTPGASFQTDGNPFEDAYFYLSPDITLLMEGSLKIAEDSGDTDLVRKIKYIQRQPSAVWMDSIGTITAEQSDGTRRGLEGHLDAAVAQQEFYAEQDGQKSPMTIVIIIYNLPDRDCAAYASNGQLYQIGKPNGGTPGNGIEQYRTDYIGKIVSIIDQPKYKDLRIVAMLEPDSYPNMITNTHGDPNNPYDDPAREPSLDEKILPDLQTSDGRMYCDTLLDYTAPGLAPGLGVYGHALQIAINELDKVSNGNVYTYLDIAHAGWLGWDIADKQATNLKRAVNGFINLIGGANEGGKSGFEKVRGFASNTSGYTPLFEPKISNREADREALKEYYEWNAAVDELTYIDMFNARIRSEQPDYNPGFIIDTARNGWGRPGRPTGTTRTYGTDASQRLDRRAHRGHWCNVNNAGVGEMPKANPDSSRPHLDAFFWMKPPGEADGISFNVADYKPFDTNPKFLALDEIDKAIVRDADNPIYAGKELDTMCIAGSHRDGYETLGVVTEPMVDPSTNKTALSPHAGGWFHKQFIMLVENAYPPLGESEYD